MRIQTFFSMMANINTSLLYQIKFTMLVNSGQFIVTYNQKSGTLNYGYCSRKLTCVHNAMSAWFLQQNEMLNKVNFKNSDNILPPPTTNEYHGTSD